MSPGWRAKTYRAGGHRIAVIGGPESTPCAVDRREGGLGGIRAAGLKPLPGNGGFAALMSTPATVDSGSPEP
jgi:DNA-binding LacI/PurR family transcriptional regulator